MATVGGTDLLYASDQITGRVITFDLTTGKRVAGWGAVGFGDGEFNSPYGIAVDPASGYLYIATAPISGFSVSPARVYS